MTTKTITWVEEEKSRRTNKDEAKSFKLISI
jgi:hypothetical protein